jgi:hypothetical protein
MKKFKILFTFKIYLNVSKIYDLDKKEALVKRHSPHGDIQFELKLRPPQTRI